VAKYDNVIFCDTSCAEDYPAQTTEGRDAIVEAVYLNRHPTFAALGKMFGFTRQMAQQIVARRDIRRAA
jgi:ribosomal protein L31